MIADWPRTEDGVVPRLVVLLGPVNSGKTTFAVALAPQMAPKERMFVVGHVPTIAERLGVPFHRVSPYERKEIQQFFARVEGTNEHLLFLLDDADIYMSARAYDAPALYTLINTGRNFGKGGILIGHGSSTIPKNLLLNSHLIAFFRTTEPNVLDYAESYMGDWPWGKDDLLEVLRNLPEHQCLLHTPLDPNRYPGFAKVVNGSIMVFPLDRPTEPEPDDDESTDAERTDASSAGGSSPGSAEAAPVADRAGESTTARPSGSIKPSGERRTV